MHEQSIHLGILLYILGILLYLAEKQAFKNNLPTWIEEAVAVKANKAKIMAKKIKRLFIVNDE